MVATRCKWNGKSSVVLQFAFQTYHPGLQNVALIWIHISTWCTYFILHFQMVSTRCKQNGKSTVVLHFAFHPHHPGLRYVAPIWIHISTWCTFFILRFQMVTPTCSIWSHDQSIAPPPFLQIWANITVQVVDAEGNIVFGLVVLGLLDWMTFLNLI